MFLLINCFIYLTLFAGILCWSFCFMHFFVSFLDEEEKAIWFALVVFLMSVIVSVLWSAVYDCGISRSHSHTVCLFHV